MRAKSEKRVLATPHEIIRRAAPLIHSIAYPASGEGEERRGVALLDWAALDVVRDLEQGCKVAGFMKSTS